MISGFTMKWGNSEVKKKSFTCFNCCWLIESGGRITGLPEGLWQHLLRGGLVGGMVGQTKW